ncbi:MULTISPECIES: hypothetical protein [unclassified Campylobacter]|uniref:hypothetical protein n=1 Tax=unclassified Campylobacter TaxID=2593542 RepID=UPI001BDA6C0B|nr:MULTISPECIES: hypothetical protein [unclassified Campylobacter]MBZ7979792.1 hypothetical protein [Campylobacter sp. RM12642]MBZ7982706.1 hypothetical protein [Campylobacter sp. RM12640]MBZ7983439.1 hypothetical protein [Campylobacter sp. RM12647]MBZ7988845.1 hypothetical protein [Campylobacter sp. RM12635]MBZ7990986.1 hypothetical protein [Campylobacter sp. RM9331]MBZ7993828.1 hypothetical protein [Campylobacter sp. RM9333]MBZ8005288.1 hypothetical protein [Campylobacter sp. RM9332]MBZ80
MNDKAKRVKYLRALEKAANRFALALKKEDFSDGIFASSIEQNLKLLNKCEPVYLDSTYSKELENFVNLCCFSQLDRFELISKFNTLEKIKKQNQYKKTKHKNQLYDNLFS